jgi:hypothetical protein
MLIYNKPLFVSKSPRKGSKSESRLVLKVGCGIKNQNSHENIFTNKVIIFEITLKFKNAIIFCYGRQKILVLITKKYLKPKCGLLLKQSHLV